VQTDVTDKSSVQECFAQIKDAVQSHRWDFPLAGVSRIHNILQKSAAEMESVRGSKKLPVVSLCWTSVATRTVGLLCLFSPRSGRQVFGSAGQSDYAFGRTASWIASRKVPKHSRFGAESLGFDDLYQLAAMEDGGMSMDTALAAWLESTLGIHPLGTGEALDILDLALRDHPEQWDCTKR